MTEECAVAVYVCESDMANDDVMNYNRSVYAVLASWLHDANKKGDYVRGYIDGEDNCKYFLEEFSDVCKSKFTTRTSWKKGGSDNRTKGRYGRNERLYWEYKSGNVTLPFTGVPFIVKSCLTKHCQFGHHYYKTTDERYQKQLERSLLDPTIEPPKEKKRRMKQTKKRECPAKMHIREIVMFEQFALDKKPTKKSLKQQKAQCLSNLRKALASDDLHNDSKLNCIQRFHVHLPLPQVHKSHPECLGGFQCEIAEYFCKKIDVYLRSEFPKPEDVYHALKNDVQQELRSRNIDFYNFPSENDIAEYIYINRIESKPTVIVEKEDMPEEDGTTSAVLPIGDVGDSNFDNLEPINMFSEPLTFMTTHSNSQHDNGKMRSCVSVDVIADPITPLTFVRDKSPLPHHKDDIIEPMLNDITVKIEGDEEDEPSLHTEIKRTQLLGDSSSQLDISGENGQKIYYGGMLGYSYTSDLVYE